jgi:RNA polymerase sigma-70 factor, ECF subfamily
MTTMDHAHGTLGDSDEDARLVHRVRAGERAAEELLYRRHVQYIGGLLIRLLGGRANAEDAIQETFVIAFEQMGTLRNPLALRGWLAQIAVSQARRTFRRKKLLRALGLDGPEEVDLNSLAGAGMTADVHADLVALAQLLVQLPADQRLAWSLRNVEGQALDDVASICKCSLATAKRRISAADEWIRHQLDVPGLVGGSPQTPGGPARGHPPTPVGYS